jgi:drug/metabolite transporter (DMT)-like permease
MAGPRPGGNWLSALALFVYAAGFSFAYVRLSTATGALILFGAVQATMILAGLAGGDRLRPRAVAGLAVALSGLLVLLLPGATTPAPAAAGLMVAAGMAWGAYSLRGRGSDDPLAQTAGNFIRATVPAAALGVVFLPGAGAMPRPEGVALAVLSGALASGVGYAIWYAALKHLTATRAATVQLSVPVIAALGGVAFLAEPITPRLAGAAVAVLGGIALSRA